MDSFKQGNNSDTSSEEIDQPEKVANDDNAGTGRSYECNFCKRGFTNAQALGGHMNIHRKDKAKLAKSKQVPADFSFSNKLSKEYMACSYFPSFMSQENPYHPGFGSHINYQRQNPTFLNMNSEFSSRIEKDCMNANLSLGMGIPYGEDNEERRSGEKIDINMGNDVDLELRIGHNP